MNPTGNLPEAKTLLVWIIVLASGLVGALGPFSSAGEPIAANSTGPVQPLPEIQLGKSVEGRPIRCRVFGEGPDTMLLIATIHGNESAGTPLVEEFQNWLKEHPRELAGRRVVILPAANPDGMAANQRTNSRGVDLNRNFPAGNWKEQDFRLHGPTPLSEPESRALMEILCRYFPDRVISIHQPVACIDYDGPGESLAREMSQACGLPVKKLGARPGSLGSFVGETLGKPIITWELPQSAGNDRAKLWAAYGEALIAALKFEQPESD